MVDSGNLQHKIGTRTDPKPLSLGVSIGTQTEPQNHWFRVLGRALLRLEKSGIAALIKQAGKGASPIEAVAGGWHPPFLEMENKTSFTNPLATYVC